MARQTYQNTYIDATRETMVKAENRNARMHLKDEHRQMLKS